MKRANRPSEKTINPETIAKAFAKAIAGGDIVNFRLLFAPFSPAREDSTERFETEKYAYLLPDAELEQQPAYREAFAAVRQAATWAHIEQELAANRPAQLSSNLLVMLGDNAVRAGKFTTAAQAYELLRIRARMQELYFQEADKALDEAEAAGPARAEWQQGLRQGLRGYVIATGLEYDYSAFPEPLPAVPDYQTRALMLHGDYPTRPEDCLALQEPETFVRIALGFLLIPEAAARLEQRSMELRTAFLTALVEARDPNWREFVQRYRDAVRTAKDFQGRIDLALKQGGGRTLAEEIAQLGNDPKQIPVQLLGRTIENGEWWQYLKEIAVLHPPSVLFVARQLIGAIEIILPRYRGDSPIPKALGLTSGDEAVVS